ncbi:sugar ABC transporter ATP-binding protein [Patescibacteria group bacterium]|nr:sugar ABC transporter ATP-binding protein [Patescibacteria group bacterium]
MVELTPIISMKNIRKKFGGITAVNNVDLDILPGIVHGVVGENGAGKSTLMRILCGFYPDYDGDIFINNELVRVTRPSIAQSKGIALVHQELSLVPELSVAENIFLGREYRSPITGLLNGKFIEEKAQNILLELDARISSREKIRNLSIAKQQLVEIAKGVSMDSKVLILDEPTSSLTAPEIDDLFKIIQKMRDSGTAILYISHKLPEVFEITDQITVLRDGIKLETRTKSDWDEAGLVKAMVGRDLSSFFSKTHSYKPKEIALEVKGLTRYPYFNKVDFQVFKGEVLGIYGLVGAGRTELAETIVGLENPDSGEIVINGQVVHIKNPKDAIENKIALVPEDRRILGLIHNFNVRQNLSLPFLSFLSKCGFIKSLEERNLAKKNIRDFGIRVPSIDSLIGTLSGGNQQKVVLGKWLNTNPKILILDDPTRGIDVGAKAEIRKIIDNLAMEGCAIVLVSSELPEITSMSDRILVMCAGKIVGEFSQELCNEQILGTYAAGVMTNNRHYQKSKI